MSPITIRLREARQARGLTQAKLAELAGVREATVNRIENNRVTSIDLDVLEKLGRALGMDPALLLATGRTEVLYRGYAIYPRPIEGRDGKWSIGGTVRALNSSEVEPFSAKNKLATEGLAVEHSVRLAKQQIDQTLGERGEA